MTARGKFKVESVADFGNGRRVAELIVTHDEAPSEEYRDRAFAERPRGGMSVLITNPRIWGVFKPGTFVYVDVTAADEELPLSAD